MIEITTKTTKTKRGKTKEEIEATKTSILKDLNTINKINNQSTSRSMLLKDPSRSKSQVDLRKQNKRKKIVKGQAGSTRVNKEEEEDKIIEEVNQEEGSREAEGEEEVTQTTTSDLTMTMITSTQMKIQFKKIWRTIMMILKIDILSLSTFSSIAIGMINKMKETYQIMIREVMMKKMRRALMEEGQEEVGELEEVSLEEEATKEVALTIKKS